MTDVRDLRSSPTLRVYQDGAQGTRVEHAKLPASENVVPDIDLIRSLMTASLGLCFQLQAFLDHGEAVQCAPTRQGHVSQVSTVPLPGGLARNGMGYAPEIFVKRGDAYVVLGLVLAFGSLEFHRELDHLWILVSFVNRNVDALVVGKAAVFE